MPGTSGSSTPVEPSSLQHTGQHTGGQETVPSGQPTGSTTTVPVASPTTTGRSRAVGRRDVTPYRRQPDRALAWCCRHAVFLVVLLAGTALRILAQLVLSPALPAAESDSYLRWFTDASGSGSALRHLLGIATGIAVYALLLRWGVWRWLAAVAAVPALWDSYLLATENLASPDTLFVFLTAVGVLVLAWQARPTAVLVVSSGVVLGVAATVYAGRVSLVLAAVLFMLFTDGTRRRRLVGALLAVVGFVLPVVPYVAWSHHVHGEYSLTRGEAVDDSGIGAAQQGQSQAADPIDGFATLLHWSPTDHAYPGIGRHLDAGQPAADTLVSYQDHGYTPGPLLLGGLLLGILAGVGLGRAGSSALRSVCMLTALLPAVVLLGPASSADLLWRSMIPGLVLWPAAGALAITALLRGRRGPSAARSQTDDVDRAALSAFRERYGDPTLAPVVVVIAAYNEAVGLPRVLTGMPSTVCGLSADVVIVDDGSTDDTAAAASVHDGAYLVSAAINRGQGAAMRLGYRVARDHGAHYIITTDADAQYDTADFPTVLAPLLDQSADFVTGSRRLGRLHTRDRFRRAGVYVFAWILSALTGERLSDTSFGLRAMRAEVTAAVTLNQPQYQSSELLIGAHSHGFRIAEVPGTMHLRAAGSTKKGGNLVYGMRYARVVFGTWWREGCPAPARERAPAMRGHPDPAVAPPPPVQ